MRASPQLEVRYCSSVVRWMIVQSKNMRKKQRIKVERAGEASFLFLICASETLNDIIFVTFLLLQNMEQQICFTTIQVLLP